MKKKLFLFAIAALLLGSATINAQEIKKEKEIKATPVKNQANSGTCWSFATISLLESELLRLGKGEWDLSEMYVVRKAYETKADRYVRLRGVANFGCGGQAHDVLDVMTSAGLMPEEAYSGLVGKKEKHDQLAMDAALAEYMKSQLSKSNALNDAHWRVAIDSIMDAMIGPQPPSFTSKDRKLTPELFAADLGLKASDYIEITSFSHHPFYSRFVLEVPDNWSCGSYYNVPLEDLMRIMTNAIDNGFTFAWDGDVSGEVSYSKNDGIAKNKDDQQLVTQEMRQKEFDRFITTDDHLMHITGFGTDENGTHYFLTKNSWGENKGNKGYWWLSENCIRLNTIAILLHKDAIPADIKAKLGIN